MTTRGDRRPPEPRGPRPLSSLLGDLFAARGLGRIQARADLEAAWAAAVGEPGVRQTRIEALRDGVLGVVVAHPALLEELRSYQKAALLEALRRALPDVVLHDLRFRVGSLTTQASPETLKPRPGPGSARTKAPDAASASASAAKPGRKPTERGG